MNPQLLDEARSGILYGIDCINSTQSSFPEDKSMYMCCGTDEMTHSVLGDFILVYHLSYLMFGPF